MTMTMLPIIKIHNIEPVVSPSRGNGEPAGVIGSYSSSGPETSGVTARVASFSGVSAPYAAGGSPATAGAREVCTRGHAPNDAMPMQESYTVGSQLLPPRGKSTGLSEATMSRRAAFRRSPRKERLAEQRSQALDERKAGSRPESGDKPSSRRSALPRRAHQELPRKPA